MASVERVYLVQEVVDENASVRSYRFDVGLAGVAFAPGQFAVVRHPHRPLRASLTFSSSACHPRDFEFSVKRVGEFGTAFYDEVRPGDALALTAAAGPFVLDCEAAQPTCFISRDYCVPALRAYVRTLRDQGRRPELLAIHELSSPGEALYHQELRASRWDGFRLLYLLDAPSAGSWQGLTGQVTADLLSRLLPDPSRVRYFLTGERPDVARYREVLTGLGVPSAQVRLERWS